MALNKKSVDDFSAKGRRVLVRCDFNVPLKNGEITDETRINAALPTIKKLIADGGKVILCSHLGKVKNGPNEGESLAPVAKSLSAKLGKDVKFVGDYNVTGADATAAVEISVENNSGTELPSTGGIGTTIFYVVGALLVIGAGVVLVTRRRMDAQ